MYRLLSERAIDAAFWTHGESRAAAVDIEVTDVPPSMPSPRTPLADLSTEELARLVANDRLDREKFVEEMERRAGDQ